VAGLATDGSRLCAKGHESDRVNLTSCRVGIALDLSDLQK